MATEDRTYSATMAWLEDLMAVRPQLLFTRPEFATEAGMLWVLVEGGEHAVLAWHAAVGGRIMPSKMTAGVWSKEVLGIRVHVRVVDNAKRGA